jgi:hypothetical protein
MIFKQLSYRNFFKKNTPFGSKNSVRVENERYGFGTLTKERSKNGLTH